MCSFPTFVLGEIGLCGAILLGCMPSGTSPFASLACSVCGACPYVWGAGMRLGRRFNGCALSGGCWAFSGAAGSVFPIGTLLLTSSFGIGAGGIVIIFFPGTGIASLGGMVGGLPSLAFPKKHSLLGDNVPSSGLSGVTTTFLGTGGGTFFTGNLEAGLPAAIPGGGGCCGVLPFIGSGNLFVTVFGWGVFIR